MGHDHAHGASENLKVAFLLNLIFVVLEIFGGMWTNSIAILTDALHDGGDCLSLGLAWYLQKVSARQPDARFTYGYQRFSSLGAFITGVVLFVGLSIVVWHSLGRLRNPTEVKPAGMLVIAVIGIAINGAAAWKLSGGRSLNEKIANWHLLEDTLGWVAVLIGSGVMLVWDVPIIDPILALVIALFVLWNVFRNLFQVALVFLQSAPAGFDIDAVKRQLAEISGVDQEHHTHTWTLDGERHVFSTHLVMAAESDRERIVAVKRRVYEILRQQDFEHITIEVELAGEQCEMEDARDHERDDHD